MVYLAFFVKLDTVPDVLYHNEFITKVVKYS